MDSGRAPRRGARAPGRTSTGCRRTSPSSWTATAAGPRSATCRASKAIAPASTPCATRSRPPPGSGIEVLTLYAFSVENWKRPATEVSTLMMLLKRYLRSELNTLLEQRHPLPASSAGWRSWRPTSRTSCTRAIERTAANARHAVQHRAELRRPRRDRRCGAPRDRGRRAARGARRGSASRAFSTRPGSPIPIC